MQQQLQQQEPRQLQRHYLLKQREQLQLPVPPASAGRVPEPAAGSSAPEDGAAAEQMRSRSVQRPGS